MESIASLVKLSRTTSAAATLTKKLRFEPEPPTFSRAELARLD